MIANLPRHEETAAIVRSLEDGSELLLGNPLDVAFQLVDGSRSVCDLPHRRLPTGQHIGRRNRGADKPDHAVRCRPASRNTSKCRALSRPQVGQQVATPDFAGGPCDRKQDSLRGAGHLAQGL